jgi:hypothetical protein
MRGVGGQRRLGAGMALAGFLAALITAILTYSAG